MTLLLVLGSAIGPPFFHLSSAFYNLPEKDDNKEKPQCESRAMFIHCGSNSPFTPRCLKLFFCPDSHNTRANLPPAAERSERAVETTQQRVIDIV